jgi:predicted transcriptional regulator
LVVARTNLTIQLDDAVIRRARMLAARRGTSLSALVARELDELVRRDDRYEDARQRAAELMAAARRRAGRTWTRDDLYAERLDRFDR